MVARTKTGRQEKVREKIITITFESYVTLDFLPSCRCFRKEFTIFVAGRWTAPMMEGKNNEHPRDSSIFIER